MFGLSPWALLWFGIVAEVIATTALKASDGFTKWGYGVVVVAGYALSFYLVSQTLKHLSLGTTYAVWSGAGTAATAVIGLALFDEAMSWPKAAGIVLVIAGVALLNSGGH